MPTSLRATHSLHDGVLHRPESGSGACRGADLAIDVLDVVVGGLGRDVEAIGDLLRRQSPGREAQAVDFASFEPAGMLLPLARGRGRLPVSGSDENRTARARLEHAL